MLKKVHKKDKKLSFTMCVCGLLPKLYKFRSAIRSCGVETLLKNTAYNVHCNRELLENNGKLLRIVITANIMVNMNINIGKECRSKELVCLMKPNGSLSKLDISHNLLSAFSASVPDANTLYK
jgi:hypothetical protein